MPKSQSIIVVIGTRPEAVKLAPLVLELKRRANTQVNVCFTGQHKAIVEQVAEFFGIQPTYDLDVMTENQTLVGLSAKLLSGLDGILAKAPADWIVVQGDTTTCFIAALAGFYRNIKVAHVEAGLRTYNKRAPFPEEINRVLTGRLADVHFPPTEAASRHLLLEGVDPSHIHTVGNTGIDAALLAASTIDSGHLSESFLKHFSDMGVNFNKRLLLVTGHRRESFGDPFRDICLALKRIAEENDVEMVYPVHPNPNVKQVVFDVLKDVKNIHLIEPLDYPALIWLLQKSYFVLTDSGGIQEEASAFGKPVLVMRDVTERPESVEAGISRLVGSNIETIVGAATQLLNDTTIYSDMARKLELYGDGQASVRIADILTNTHSRQT